MAKSNAEIRETFNLIHFCTELGLNIKRVAELLGICHRAVNSIYCRRATVHLTAAAFILMRTYAPEKASAIDKRLAEIIGDCVVDEFLDQVQSETLISRLKITWAKASRICLVDRLSRIVKDDGRMAYRYAFILVATQHEYETLQSGLSEIALAVAKAKDVIDTLLAHYGDTRCMSPEAKAKDGDSSNLGDRSDLVRAGMDYEALDAVFSDYRPAVKLHEVDGKVGAHEYVIAAMWLADSEATERLLLKARDFVDDAGIWPDPSYVSTLRKRLVSTNAVLNEVLMVSTMPYYYTRVAGSYPDDHLFAIACVLRIYFKKEMVELLDKSPLVVHDWMKHYNQPSVTVEPPSIRAPQDPMREKTAYLATHLNSWYGKNSHAQQ